MSVQTEAAARPSAVAWAGPVSQGFAWAVVGVLGVLQVVHLVARGAAWTVDLLWAVDQYLFSMVFFGPVVCGLAAWQGRLFWQGRWLARVHPGRAVRAYLGPVVVLALGVFLAGLAAALLMALRRGTPFVWGSGQTAGVLEALLVIGAYAAVGFAAGAWWPVRVVPVMAAAAAFAATMAGWLGGFETLVRFGGVSGAVDGIEVRPEAWAARLLFWVGLGVLALLAARRRVRRAPRERLVAAVAALSMVAGLLWASAIPNMFRRDPVVWACDGNSPQVCVPERMQRFLPQILAMPEPLQLARELQAASPNTARVWRLSDPLLFPDLAAARDSADREAPARATDRMLLGAQQLWAPGCLDAQDDDPWQLLSAQQAAAADAVYAWVYLTTDSSTSHSADEFASLGVPQAPLGSPQARAFLAGKLDTLPPCPR